MDLHASLMALDKQCADWLVPAPLDDPRRPAILDLRDKTDDAIELLEAGALLTATALLEEYEDALGAFTKQLNNLASTLANLEKFWNAIGTLTDAVSQIVTALTGTG